MADAKQEVRAEFQAARTEGLKERHRIRLERRWEEYDQWMRRVEEARITRREQQ